MNNKKYDIIIHYSPDDECYLAYAPDLPGCIADGETLAEAANAIGEEIDLWIDINKERGVEIPKPSRRLETVTA